MCFVLFDPLEVSVLPNRPPPPPPYLHMAQELLSNSCIEVVDPSTPITMQPSIRPKPNSEKCLLIADCRQQIQHEAVASKHFSLPKLDILWSHLPICTSPHYPLPTPSPPTTCLAFTKIDLTNAYWTCILPHSQDDVATFVFAIGDTHYRLSSLPFGWDKSPVIFQDVLGKLLAAMAPQEVIILQYLDDVLLMSFDSTLLQSATQSIVDDLTLKGFIVSMKKTVLIPTSTITWLNKLISATPTSVSITPTVDSLISAYVLTTLVFAKVWPRKVLRSLTGLLTWMSLPARLTLPFLQPTHRWLLSKSTPFLPRHVRQHLLKGLSLLDRETTSPTFSWSPPPLPARQWWFFYDASAEEGFIGIVVSPPFNAPALVYSFPLPHSISVLGPNGQQLAELYALKRTVQLIVSHRLDCALLLGDNSSSIYTVLKFSCKASDTKRAKLLRQIAYAVSARPSLQLHIGFIPSEFNPADAPSHPHGNFRAKSVKMLRFVRTHPGYIAMCEDQFPSHRQRCLSDVRLPAWLLPSSLRIFLLSQPNSPDIDLAADQLSAVCPLWLSDLTVDSANALITKHAIQHGLFNPPWHLLDTLTPIALHLLSATAMHTLWCIFPTTFLRKLHVPSHISMSTLWSMNLEYVRVPPSSQPGAHFLSSLVLLQIR